MSNTLGDNPDYLAYVASLPPRERAKMKNMNVSGVDPFVERKEQLEKGEMSWEIRVVDTGDSLTVGRVLLDPLGEPYTTEIDILYADSLTDLHKMIDEITDALKKPVLSMRNLV